MHESLVENGPSTWDRRHPSCDSAKSFIQLLRGTTRNLTPAQSPSPRPPGPPAQPSPPPHLSTTLPRSADHKARSASLSKLMEKSESYRPHSCDCSYPLASASPARSVPE